GAAGLADRIRLSSGTSPGSTIETPDRRYGPGTFVPRGPFRRSSAEELGLLTFDPHPAGEPHWRSSADMAIVRIPDEIFLPLVETLEEHGVRQAADRASYQSVGNHPRWAQNLDAVGRYLATLCDQRLDRISFRIAEPNRFTLTKD